MSRYVKNIWVDLQGQVRYSETLDDGYKIFTPNYEEVTEMGTPVNATNMNHIEEGIEECYDYVDDEIQGAKDYSLNLLKTIYPIGSIYIGTTNACPLESLFGTWTLVATDRVLQGSSTNHAANTTIAAGLPDITGSFRVDSGEASPTGCFSRSNISGTDGGGGAPAATYSFKASRSSSIYGNSSTVQPPAYVVNIWRRTA